jgi:CRISPR-associated protein Cmr6
MPNLSYQYYKGYYNGFHQFSLTTGGTFNGWELEKETRKKYVQDIENFFTKANKPFKVYQISNDNISFIEGKQSIKLETTYPGLLFGTGYTHGIGEVGEFKLGFYFDYTSGSPLIPGHAVKGTIRSAFPVFKDNKKLKDENETAKQINEVKAKWIAALLNQIDSPDREFIDKHIEPKENLEEGDLERIYLLQLEIFEGIINPNEENSDKKYLSIYKRDIFHEAIPVESLHQNHRVLDTDSITPHIKKNLS